MKCGDVPKKAEEVTTEEEGDLVEALLANLSEVLATKYQGKQAGFFGSATLKWMETQGMVVVHSHDDCPLQITAVYGERSFLVLTAVLRYFEDSDPSVTPFFNFGYPVTQIPPAIIGSVLSETTAILQVYSGLLAHHFAELDPALLPQLPNPLLPLVGGLIPIKFSSAQMAVLRAVSRIAAPHHAGSVIDDQVSGVYLVSLNYVFATAPAGIVVVHVHKA